MATPAEIEAATAGLTADQIKWLGNADPTDPFIRARGGLPPLPTQTTVPSASSVETIEKYETPDNVDTRDFETEDQSDPYGVGPSYENDGASRTEQEITEEYGKRSVPGVNPGAMPSKNPEPKINVTDVSGKKLGKDLRVRIKVPPAYLTSKTTGLNNELSVSKLHGIVFPYTPIISVQYKADYTAANPIHSNFPVQFYQRSSIGNISISGKFSVENVTDAAIFIATTRLLKALTKMRSGGYSGDPDSGSPPPVCRLFGHGDWMFNNVPIAISSFKVEFTDAVDYFTMPDNAVYGMTAVPTMSTISVECVPMYSRNEMLNFNVTDYLSNNNNYNNKGYM